MKLKRVSGEIDLCVQPGGLTKSESKEFSDFIEEFKRKRKSKKDKQQKAA
jgi:polyhydroxyalkanoate synthesis regulator phasin